MVNGKNQRALGAGKTGRYFRRKITEAKTSDRAGIWAQRDMNTLSFSWKLPVDWWAP
jgi:hypothetical protein